MHSRGLTSNTWLVFLGITLLSGGASALNQIQERNYDARMKRTMMRPIPANIVRVINAGIFSAILIFSGLIILFYFGNFNSFIVGLFSLLWYNFLYTYLKRTTAFAVFIGIFTGIGPVFIGWLAAGGGWFDKDCLLLASFMSVWQIAHFLLLMLLYEDDYRHAGFPLLTDRHSADFVKMLITLAVFLINFIVVLLFFLKVINLPIMQISSAIITLLLFVFAIYKLFGKVNNYRQVLMAANIYMMVIMIIIFIDCLGVQ